MITGIIAIIIMGIIAMGITATATPLLITTAGIMMDTVTSLAATIGTGIIGSTGMRVAIRVTGTADFMTGMTG